MADPEHSRETHLDEVKEGRRISVAPLDQGLLGRFPNIGFLAADIDGDKLPVTCFLVPFLVLFR